MRRNAVVSVGAFDPRLVDGAALEMWLRLSLQFDVGFIAEPLVIGRPQEECQGFENLRNIEQEFLAKATALERSPEKVPGYLQTKFALQRQHGERALWLARRYYGRKDWNRATECVHASMGLTLPDDWGDSRFLRWFLDRAMKREPVVKTPAVGAKYLADRRALELAEHVTFARLFKAIAAKAWRDISRGMAAVTTVLSRVRPSETPDHR
jgi:hypothetical protein